VGLEQQYLSTRKAQFRDAPACDRLAEDLLTVSATASSYASPQAHGDAINEKLKLSQKRGCIMAKPGDGRWSTGFVAYYVPRASSLSFESRCQNYVDWANEIAYEGDNQPRAEAEKRESLDRLFADAKAKGCVAGS
jgi:hypothetical protein